MISTVTKRSLRRELAWLAHHVTTRHRGTSEQDSRQEPGGQTELKQRPQRTAHWLALPDLLSVLSYRAQGHPSRAAPPYVPIIKKMPYWYFWRLFVSFCFCVFWLFVLLVFSIFDFCFCGVLLYVCFLGIFFVCFLFFCFSFLGEKNRERKHKVEWIGSREDLGKLREQKTWSKYIVRKFF